MRVAGSGRATGHVTLVQRQSGPRWYAKYRLSDGKQIQRVLGPAWTEKGRPPDGYFTKRTAQDWLNNLLADARRGTIDETARIHVSFEDAAQEWLRYVEHERGVRPSTLADYRYAVEGTLVPTFGEFRLNRITTDLIDRWVAARITGGKLSRRTVNKHITILNGIFRRARKAYGLRSNPVADAERPPEKYSGDFDVFSPDEVWALARAAQSELDRAIYLVAAFAGLRMGEILALRWRDVDFPNATIRVRASISGGELGAPKSGRVRSVPLVPELANVLGRLSERERFTEPDDLVATSDGNPIDRSVLRRRFLNARKVAKLRSLRFHDLRHTFGSLAINKASIAQVQAWMGHAHVTTTMRYLHAKARHDDAALLAGAFAPRPDP